MALAGFFRGYRTRARRRDAAHALYVSAVRQARAPAFYSEFGVPDSLDGRFDLIVLHVVTLLRRLRKAGEPGRDLAQAVFDVMFDDMDQSLREMGVGDLKVGKRVKQMARAFYGRAEAYEHALDSAQADGKRGAIARVIERNIFGGAPTPTDATLDALAAYVDGVAATLETQADDALLAGGVQFPVVPEAASDPAPIAAPARVASAAG